MSYKGDKMEEKYSYLSTIMKFKESCFGLNGIKKLLLKKIIKFLLIIIALIGAALAVIYVIFLFTESNNDINELIKIAATNDSKVVILWLMFGIIILYLLTDVKITIDDRIELFTKEILSNKKNQTDILVLDSGILRTELVDYVSLKDGINSLILIDLLINDNTTMFSKLYSYLNDKGTFNELSDAEKTLYFVISLKYMLTKHREDMFAYYFKDKESIEKFCDFIFKEKSNFFIDTIEEKNPDLFTRCFYAWNRW